MIVVLGQGRHAHMPYRTWLKKQGVGHMFWEVEAAALATWRVRTPGDGGVAPQVLFGERGLSDQLTGLFCPSLPSFHAVADAWPDADRPYVRQSWWAFWLALLQGIPNHVNAVRHDALGRSHAMISHGLNVVHQCGLDAAPLVRWSSRASLSLPSGWSLVGRDDWVHDRRGIDDPPAREPVYGLGVPPGVSCWLLRLDQHVWLFEHDGMGWCQRACDERLAAQAQTALDHLHWRMGQLRVVHTAGGGWVCTDVRPGWSWSELGAFEDTLASALTDVLGGTVTAETVASQPLPSSVTQACYIRRKWRPFHGVLG